MFNENKNDLFTANLMSNFRLIKISITHCLLSADGLKLDVVYFLPVAARFTTPLAVTLIIVGGQVFGIVTFYSEHRWFSSLRTCLPGS